MDMQGFRELVAKDLRLGAIDHTGINGSAGPVVFPNDRDPLPELIHYRDEGCDISPSCLRCPLPQCRYDDPGWLRREAKARRDQEVLKLQKAEGLGPTELATRFSLSRRTIHRILRALNESK